MSADLKINSADQNSQQIVMQRIENSPGMGIVQDLLQAMCSRKLEEEAQEYFSLQRFSWHQVLPAIFEETASPKSTFPMQVAEIIGEYIEKPIFMAAVNLPEYMALTKKEVLKACFAKSCRAEVHFSSAIAVIQRVYETKLREVGTNGAWGRVFPMDPEVLGYAMKLAKDETVLEIAGATGENGILLAFSDAKRVYVNDLDADELNNFEKLKKTLPQQVQKKLEAIKGSCFEIPKIKPEIVNKIGLVLCRNLIHFFNDEKEKAFFALLEKILKPGGRGIFIANSVYAYRNWRAQFEADTQSTSWEITRFRINDQISGESMVFCEDASSCSQELIDNTFSVFDISKRSMGGEWLRQQKAFSQLSSAVQKKVNASILRNSRVFEAIKAGSISAAVLHTRMYNKQTLPALFARNGYEVEETFVVKIDGHLLDDPDFHNGGQQIGVVVRRPLF